MSARDARDGTHAAASTDPSSSTALSVRHSSKQSRKAARRQQQKQLDTELTAAQATRTSQLLWRIAMRMSLHNESRLLQHFSRSMLHAGPHKHVAQAENEPAHFASTRMIANSASAEATASTLTAHGSAKCAKEAASDKSAALSLPPLPPLVFSPSKKQQHMRSHGLTFFYYCNWPIKGLRPGLSIRVVQPEAGASASSAMECVLHVVDLHTKVFWIVKKRFSDVYWLRKKICARIRSNETTEANELKYLLDLPFPRRTWRTVTPDSFRRRLRDVEAYLRNVAALEPTTPLRVEIERELQWSMCTPEFIASLEKIDTSGETRAPKWLHYHFFRMLNSVETIEGHTCYKFLQAFRNRCAVIEAAECPHCHSFTDACLAVEALKDLRNVLTSVEKFIADHLCRSYSDQLSRVNENMDKSSLVDQIVSKAVEDTLLVPLDREITFLVGRTVDAAQEARLMANIGKMRGRPQSEFGIPSHLQSDDNWGKSCHYMSMIDERALPCEKIQELLQSALEIFKSCGEKDLEWRETSALTADDYLPIHIYVVIHSGLLRPLLLKEYLGAMIHPSQMKGEVGYFLTMFEVALQYIADM